VRLTETLKRRASQFLIMDADMELLVSQTLLHTIIIIIIILLIVALYLTIKSVAHL
jgi:type IV secretory pathway TrbD component